MALCRFLKLGIFDNKKINEKFIISIKKIPVLEVLILNVTARFIKANVSEFVIMVLFLTLKMNNYLKRKLVKDGRYCPS
jgi:hypothetical protein